MKEVVIIPNASRPFEAFRNLNFDIFFSDSDVQDTIISKRLSNE